MSFDGGWRCHDSYFHALLDQVFQITDRLDCNYRRTGHKRQSMKDSIYRSSSLVTLDSAFC